MNYYLSMNQLSPEQKIRTKCPACNSETLFISSNGQLCCSLIGCPNPMAINQFEDLALAHSREKEELEQRLALEQKGSQQWLAKAVEGERDNADLRVQVLALQAHVERLRGGLEEIANRPGWVNEGNGASFSPANIAHGYLARLASPDLGLIERVRAALSDALDFTEMEECARLHIAQTLTELGAKP